MEDKLSPLNTKTNQNERTMKDTHTPGPWHVKNGNSIYASNRYIGLSMSGHLYGNDLPKEANARLMAAAPELLEIVKAFLGHDIEAGNRATTIAKKLIKQIEEDETRP